MEFTISAPVVAQAKHRERGDHAIHSQAEHSGCDPKSSSTSARRTRCEVVCIFLVRSHLLLFRRRCDLVLDVAATIAKRPEELALTPLQVSSYVRIVECRQIAAQEARLVSPQ